MMEREEEAFLPFSSGGLMPEPLAPEDIISSEFH
jgi:hypothetical protein